MDELTSLVLDPRIGNAASVIGLLISLVGFTGTIWVATRSKRAAEAAQAAALDARARIARTDALTEFATAITTLDEIKRLHREKALSMLPDRYSALKKSLILIRTADPGLSDEHKTKIQGAIQHLSNNERKIENALASDDGSASVPRLNQILSSQIEMLTEVFAEIRNEIQR